MEHAFNIFCFEADDQKSIILNYSALRSLKTFCTNDDIIKKLMTCATDHMQAHNTQQFIFHLFCNGMVLKDMVAHRTFMRSLAVMFRDTFPTQLYACYVHHAPHFFRSIYDLLHSILPRSARSKIIILPTTSDKSMASLKKKNKNDIPSSTSTTPTSSAGVAE
jgi:hypothetical protein